MQFIWCSSDGEFDRLAAGFVESVLSIKPDAALALPTGQTPVGMYAELALRHRRRQLDLAGAWLFNLDEYVGLSATHPLSYHRYLHAHLLEPAALQTGRVRLLNGAAADLDAECAAYEAAIAAAGGLDLAILGLGANGHVAFNEPGSDPASTTCVVTLSEQTRAAQQRLTGFHYESPATGITLGLATLCAARAILLLIAGHAKREALHRLQAGAFDPQWPVTALLAHPYVTVLCAPSLKR